MAVYPDHLDLGPLDRAAGTVRLPGSKSISNRILLLAALAEGRTRIHDLLASDDVERMLDDAPEAHQVDREQEVGEVEIRSFAVPLRLDQLDEAAPYQGRRRHRTGLGQL